MKSLIVAALLLALAAFAALEAWLELAARYLQPQRTKEEDTWKSDSAEALRPQS